MRSLRRGTQVVVALCTLYFLPIYIFFQYLFHTTSAYSNIRLMNDAFASLPISLFTDVIATLIFANIVLYMFLTICDSELFVITTRFFSFRSTS